MMDNLLKNLALALNGVEYRKIEAKLKELNLLAQGRFVILYGASDDLLELRGAIDEEFGAYNGFDYQEYGSNQSDCDPDILEFLSNNEITAVWCPDAHRSWMIKSNSRHLNISFDIMEGNEIFCTGLIIDLETTTKSFKSEIKKLEAQLTEYNTYYREGAPRVSDEVYDALEAKLIEFYPESKLLKKVGVKSKASIKTQKVKHATKMLSLDKAYTVDEIMSWSKDRELIALKKIDGSSCSLIYIDGDLVKAKTRGDGIEGEDITEHVQYIDDIPKKLNKKISIEVRGELYCQKTTFGILSDEMATLGLDRPVSERNIVAGLIGRKSHIFLCKYLCFFAYTMIDERPFSNNLESESLDELYALDFAVPSYHRINSLEEATNHISEVTLFKSHLDYLIDGIVFIINSIDEQKKMGYTSHHPKYKLAYKFKAEDKETIINEIKWQVSRNGVLTPVAVVETVELSGANVSNVTLHNYGIVRDFNLKVGDLIKITRSGEVIPKFLSVVASFPGLYVEPKTCPNCHSDLSKEDIRLFCKNTSCSSRVVEEILNYLAVMNIEDINEKRIEELLSKGLISTIDSLYDLTIEKLLLLDKVQSKSASKIFNNIQASKSPKLSVFFVANGISSLGLSSCEKIINAGYDTFEKFLNLTEADIVAIDGFSNISAQNILTSLKAKLPTIIALTYKGVIPANAERIVDFASPILGKSFCITGSLSRPRKEIEDLLKSKGATIVSSVSTKTNYLLTNEVGSGSSKAEKALNLGITILSEADLEQLLLRPN